MKPTKSNRFSLLLATSGLLFSGVLYSQTVEIDPAGAIPGTHTQVKAWEFNTDGDAEGWTGNGYGSVVAPLVVAGGVISGDTTNGDPQFGNTFAAIPLGYGTIIEYGLKINPLAAAASGGSFFWADYGGGIAGPRSKGVTIPEDNALHVVRVTFPGGVKNLTSLRLDPTSTTAKTVSFDYVRVYHYQPVSFTNVTLTANDAAGTTSMNSAGGWDSLQAPTTESNYFTGAFQLRSQAGTPYLPFGGSALSVDPGGSLLFKGNGGTLVRQMTLAGGSLLQGATGATPDTVKLFVPDGISVTAASTLDTVAPTRTIEITGSLNGSANLVVKGLVPGAAQVPGQIVLKSDSTAYTGALTVDANALLDLDHDTAVAGASVIVNTNGQVRRTGADADGTTTAASWAITGRGPVLGTDNTRGAIYINRDGLNGTLAGPISISGAQARIGMYSGGGNLTLGGNITGTGTLELWGGGGAENNIQRFILNGTSTLDGQTDLLADFGAQSHIRLGGDNRLATNRRLRMNATWAAGSPAGSPPGTPEGAGAFLDLNGFDQTLSNLQLDGVRRKVIHDTTASGNSVLTLSANTNAFDTNGGNVYINGITITHTGPNADSGVQIDNASVVTLNNATWNAPFYSSLGNSGAGTLILNNSTFSFGGELLMARSSNNGTLTVDATSLATTPNYFRIGDSAAGVATVNLNGGTLAARSFRNGNTGTSILNLDGGILRATGANPVDWIGNGVTVNLLDGGITLDSNNFNVRATAAILEDSGSTDGGITKIGVGTLTLAADNTYTGSTDVQVGTLILDGDNSAATGDVTVASNAGIGGDGTLGGNVTMDIDSKFVWTVEDWNGAPSLSVPDLTNNGTATDPMVVVIGEKSLLNFTETNKTFTILSASGTFTSADPAGIVVDDSGFTTGSGTWAVQKSGNILELVYTAGTLSPYDSWLNTYPAITGTNRAPDVDFDNDGVANGIEFLTGTSPANAADSEQPSVTRNVGGDLVVSFQRDDAAEAYDVSVESSTTLQAPWTSVMVPDSAITGPPVTVVDNGSSADDVTVIVPAGGAPAKFARVKIEIPFTP